MRFDLGCGSRPRGEINLDLWTGQSPHHWIPIDPRVIQRFVKGDIHQLPFRDNVASQVMVSHVLEHCPNPDQVLLEVARVLGPGGRLVLKVPNNPLFGEHPEHLYSWSTSSLRALVSRHFKNIRIWWYSRPNLGQRMIMRILDIPLLGPGLLRWFSPWISLEIHVEAWSHDQ